MQKADDRVNNDIVIDEDGYIKIIDKDKEINYLYPVRYGELVAGNNSVGKYSSLSNLDDIYIYLLECWLEYLQRGKSIYKDYIEFNLREEELITKIEEYY